jgi:hypothetical protein
MLVRLRVWAIAPGRLVVCVPQLRPMAMTIMPERRHRDTRQRRHSYSGTLLCAVQQGADDTRGAAGRSASTVC